MDSVLPWYQFYLQWSKRGSARVVGITALVNLFLGLVIRATTPYLPPDWAPVLNTTSWAVPAAVFLAALLGGLVVAPYRMYVEREAHFAERERAREAKVGQLQTELAAAKAVAAAAPNLVLPDDTSLEEHSGAVKLAWCTWRRAGLGTRWHDGNERDFVLHTRRLGLAVANIVKDSPDTPAVDLWAGCPNLTTAEEQHAAQLRQLRERNASLERTIDERPRLVLTCENGPDFDRIVSVTAENPLGGRARLYDAFVKSVLVETSKRADNCRVRVNALWRDGQPIPGFIPTFLRWYGYDGAGSDSLSFSGRAFVLLVNRRPDGEWRLQTPVADDAGAQFSFGPGSYRFEFVVTADNALEECRRPALLRVGDRQDDVQFEGAL